MPRFKYFSVLIISAVLALSGCSVKKSVPAGQPPQKIEKASPSKPPKKPGPPQAIAEKQLPDRSFEGTWTVSDSTAEFTIRITPERVVMTGRDSDDREKFKIKRLSWNSEALFATVVMPSTNHILNIKLTILDNDKLQCYYSGDVSGLATWQRKR